MYANAARVYHQGQVKLHKKVSPVQMVSPTSAPASTPASAPASIPTYTPVPHPCPNTEWMVHINPLSVLPNPLTSVPTPKSTAYMEIVLVDEDALKQPRSCVPSLFSFLKSIFTVC
ncbi:WW domain-containing adapter protein with coiled-coil-like [Haliotis rubra]|uniref:WW domain-containing adapter protein with coiled-coil-like n=1 Tax=Haliotis rubra TaxID=36100 RepID=UPI001EE50DFF|nr:WW domain-containing adapter protein with coiled-coil-like [Haliotis rubra]